MVAKSASKDRSRDKIQDEVVAAKSDSKERFKVKTQYQDTEIESLPSPPRRQRRSRVKRDQPPVEDEEHSVSTSFGLTLGVTESKTKVKVRLRRFFSRMSPKNPRIPQPSTLDILEDLSFTEEAISRSSSRLLRKSFGDSHSSEDNKAVSGTSSKTITDNSQSTNGNNALDSDILDNKDDGSETSMESDANVEVYEIAKALQYPNSWSDRVKDARRYYPSSPVSLAEAERRGLLTPVQESMKSDDEKSEGNTTAGFILSRTGNDLPGVHAKEIPWKSEMTDYRDENFEEIRNKEQNDLRDESFRDDSPRSAHTHLLEEYLEDCFSRDLSRNEEPDVQGILPSGSAATYATTETTLKTVAQLKRDLELFSLENVAERMLPNMQCQESGTNNTDHVLPSKPWCYASEQGELFHEVRSEAYAAPASDRMFGCMPLPELYTSSSPPVSPTHRSRNPSFMQVAHGHPGMNIMADITSFGISQSSTGSGSFSEDNTAVYQSDIEPAASGRTTFTEDSESLSLQTDDEQTEDDDFTQTEDDSDSSVSTVSAPDTGSQFLSWIGSPVSSNSDSDSDSCSTVHAQSNKTKDPSLFKWLHRN